MPEWLAHVPGWIADILVPLIAACVGVYAARRGVDVQSANAMRSETNALILEIHGELVTLQRLNEACYGGHGDYYSRHFQCLQRLVARLNTTRVGHESGALLHQTAADLVAVVECGEPRPYTPEDQKDDFVTPVLLRLRERFPDLFKHWDEQEEAAANAARTAIERYNSRSVQGLHAVRPWHRRRLHAEQLAREASEAEAAARNAKPYSPDLRPGGGDSVTNSAPGAVTPGHEG